MPAWLLWLLPVPLATLAAVVWTAWTGRTRPLKVADSVAAHERFRRAMSEAVPAPRQRRSSGD